MPPPPQRPASTRGAKILTFTGGGVLVLGIIALVAAFGILMSAVPTGIVTGSGNPGDDVLVDLAVPGTTEIEATAGSEYSLWTVSERSGSAQTKRQDIEVRDPEGKSVLLTGPSVTGTNTRNHFTARSLANFTAPTSGTYEIVASGTDLNASGERIFVSQAQEFSSFFAGIFGFIGLMFIGVGGGIVGFGMTLGGIIWWVVASNKKKRQAQFPGGPPPPTTAPYRAQGGF